MFYYIVWDKNGEMYQRSYSVFIRGRSLVDDQHWFAPTIFSILFYYDQPIATCNGGNIRISSNAIRESSECITDSTRTPSIVENIVGANHCWSSTSERPRLKTLYDRWYISPFLSQHILGVMCSLQTQNWRKHGEWPSSGLMKSQETSGHQESTTSFVQPTSERVTIRKRYRVSW
jgi:hypothetical protein